MSLLERIGRGLVAGQAIGRSMAGYLAVGYLAAGCMATAELETAESEEKSSSRFGVSEREAQRLRQLHVQRIGQYDARFAHRFVPGNVVAIGSLDGSYAITYAKAGYDESLLVVRRADAFVEAGWIAIGLRRPRGMRTRYRLYEIDPRRGKVISYDVRNSEQRLCNELTTAGISGYSEIIEPVGVPIAKGACRPFSGPKRKICEVTIAGGWKAFHHYTGQVIGRQAALEACAPERSDLCSTGEVLWRPDPARPGRSIVTYDIRHRGRGAPAHVKLWGRNKDALPIPRVAGRPVEPARTPYSLWHQSALTWNPHHSMHGAPTSGIRVAWSGEHTLRLSHRAHGRDVVRDVPVVCLGR